MKKVNSIFSHCGTISKYRALADVKPLVKLIVNIVAADVFCVKANQHEKLQIVYANLRV
ncbi:hypothetical protein [Flavobacterium coralii]|jgi:hypothetical protein|uniref:hypothetical protein n=1 Tax=Flavobacterium coralii TaxID=2838017 RepID=UPI001CA6516E|nr:hypothetical protein [Flavobacterium coralii]MBY8961972.1 hypothetical protein [Flavobacterium coralii]